MMKYGKLLLALVVMQQCCSCMAGLDQLLQTFKQVTDMLVPPEKAAKLKVKLFFRFCMTDSFYAWIEAFN